MLLNTIAAAAGVLLLLVTCPLAATTIHTTGETAWATNTRAVLSMVEPAVSPASLGAELRFSEEGSGTYSFALIRSAMAALPEPESMFLVGTALVALSLLGNKRRES